MRGRGLPATPMLLEWLQTENCRPRPLAEKGASHPHTKFQPNPSKYVAVGAENLRFSLVGVAYGHAHPALGAENLPGGPRAPSTEFVSDLSSHYVFLLVGVAKQPRPRPPHPLVGKFNNSDSSIIKSQNELNSGRLTALWAVKQPFCWWAWKVGVAFGHAHLWGRVLRTPTPNFSSIRASMWPWEPKNGVFCLWAWPTATPTPPSGRKTIPGAQGPLPPSLVRIHPAVSESIQDRHTDTHPHTHRFSVLYI